MNEFAKREYEQKRTTAENAVKLVDSGNTIHYGEFALFPEALDQALAERVNELENITVRSTFFTKLPKIADADVDNKNFIIEDYHFSSISRVLQQRNLCYYIPMLYHQVPGIIEKFIDIDVAFVTTSPMDAKGFFNFGLANSITAAALNKAKRIVVEVNENVPSCLGGNQEAIHISRVTHIVESDHSPLVEIKPFEPREIDYKIAEHIMKELEDGSCLQLGIGGLPNIIGSMIADSDLKDLGCHTEILTDSAVKLFESGKLTGARKIVDKYKLTYTFALGTKKLYDFLSDNPICASYPADYVTDPSIIAINDNVIAINNALEVDILGQVCSETIGSRQISGSGGQLEFMLGAFGSMGGKGLICLSSTYTSTDGDIISRIRPSLSAGAIVTLPRSVVYYVTTEYGTAFLKGKSTWTRAEALIDIAHPDFRDELIKEAQKMKIWLKSNKIEG